MRLTDTQADRFYLVYNAVLFFANGYLGLDEPFDPQSFTFRPTSQRRILAEALADPDAIDAFARENPFGLVAADLGVVRSWKGSSEGRYCVVLRPGRRALFMGEEATFLVSGIVQEVDELLSREISFVSTTLLPFDGAIVYAVNLWETPVSIGAGLRGVIMDDVARSEAEGPIAMAGEFMLKRSQLGQERARREAESAVRDLEESQLTGDDIPGFHRGALAGKDAVGRAAAMVAAGALAREASEPSMRAVGGLVGRVGHFAEAVVDLRGIVSVEALIEEFSSHEGEADAKRIEAALRTLVGSRQVGFALRELEGRLFAVAYELDRDAGLTATRLLTFHETALAKAGPRPLTEEMLAADSLMAWRQQRPAALALESFLNEFVPDAWHDRELAYAKDVVGELIMLGAGPWEPRDIIAAYEGFGLCQLPEWQFNRLFELTANLFNALPSWLNAGWSPNELAARREGARAFFNEDGSRMVVGLNDPCPCGSGKKYKRCCGK